MIGPFPPPLMGPAVRNHLINDELERRGIETITANTVGNKITFIINFFKGVFRCNMVYLSTSKNGQFFFVPILYCLDKFFSNRIIFYPAGGQLFEHIQALKPLFSKQIIKMISQFDFVFVQTRGMKSKLESLMPNKQINYLPNPKPYKIKEVNFFNIKTDYDKRKILFLSRIRKEKGVELLLDAINHIEHNYKITVYVDFFGLITNDYIKRFNELISSKKNFKYFGVLPPNNYLIETIAQYYCMVFPSYWENEGFPGVLADAALAGLPVIASDVGYNKEIIKENYNGLIFEKGNYIMLAEKMLYLLSNTQTRNEMAKNNLNISENYLINKCIDKMLNIISDNYEK